MSIVADKHISHMTKARDFRRFAVCTYCTYLGDHDRMIAGITHPGCYARDYADRFDRIMALPDYERGKFTLGDLMAGDFIIEQKRAIAS